MLKKVVDIDRIYNVTNDEIALGLRGLTKIEKVYVDMWDATVLIKWFGRGKEKLLLTKELIELIEPDDVLGIRIYKDEEGKRIGFIELGRVSRSFELIMFELLKNSYTNYGTHYYALHINGEFIMERDRILEIKRENLETFKLDKSRGILIAEIYTKKQEGGKNEENNV